MKKCEYCGRENADEAAACGECGQAWFTAIAPEVKKEAPERHFGFRFLTALLMGFAVLGLSLYVAWQNARGAEGLRKEQWLTQYQLSDLSDGLRSYQKQFGAFPQSLKQFADAMNNANLESSNKNDKFLDGWGHEFIYSFDGKKGVITSYGRDGKPGGAGLDCDLTNLNPTPENSLLTCHQFLFEMPTKGMINGCIATGFLAALLWFFTVKRPDFTGGGILVLVIRLGAIVIGTWFVAGVISLLHLPPSGGH